jgi:hypothetical protein
MKRCLKQFEWRRRLRRLGVGLGIGARLVIITAQRSAERSMHPPGNPQTRDVHRIYREPRFLYRGFKVQVIVPQTLRCYPKAPISPRCDLSVVTAAPNHAGGDLVWASPKNERCF